MLTLDDAASMTGSTLASADASAIGDVVDVYIDAATKRPKWAVVRQITDEVKRPREEEDGDG